MPNCIIELGSINRVSLKIKLMENHDNDTEENGDISETALEKHSDKSAGKTIPWTMIVAIIVLLIIMLVFFAKYFKNF